VRFVISSIVVIVATGVVRTLNFMRFEWQPAMGDALLPVLVVKHILIFSFLGAGIYVWVQLRGRVRQLPGWRE
jgi:hypothetical protein